MLTLDELLDDFENAARESWTAETPRKLAKARQAIKAKIDAANERAADAERRERYQIADKHRILGEYEEARNKERARADAANERAREHEQQVGFLNTVKANLHAVCDQYEADISRLHSERDQLRADRDREHAARVKAEGECAAMREALTELLRKIGAIRDAQSMALQPQTRSILGATMRCPRCREFVGRVTTWAGIELCCECWEEIHPGCTGTSVEPRGVSERALATDAGRALLDELSELRGKVARYEQAIERASRSDCVTCEKPIQPSLPYCSVACLDNAFGVDASTRSDTPSSDRALSPGGSVNTGVGEDGKQPMPRDVYRLRLHMPRRLEVVTFKAGDRWAIEVHGYTDDVTNGQPTRIRTRAWRKDEPTAQDLHDTLTTWIDHELREQLGMDPHAPGGKETP